MAKEATVTRKKKAGKKGDKASEKAKPSVSPPETETAPLRQATHRLPVSSATVGHQLTAWLGNKPGRLLKLANALAAEQLNIIAISANESVDTAEVRLVTSDATLAKSVLRQAKIPFGARKVLVLQLYNAPGAMGLLGSALAEAGINVDYMYGSTHPQNADATLVLACDDVHKALEVIS